MDKLVNSDRGIMDGKYLTRKSYRSKNMSMFVGQNCIICSTKITEENDAHFLEEILGLETFRKLENYQKPLCVDCKRELLLY